MQMDIKELKSGSRLGIVLGTMAVLFWSFGASFVYLGATEAGTWPFVTVATLVGGIIQLVFRRWYRGELRTAIWLPWRLWLITLFCFVVYGLVFPWALVTSTPRQVFGVSLINYLWPILTILFSAIWVPGMRLTAKNMAAMILALVGLVVANLRPIQNILSGSEAATVSTIRYFLPYGLALVAAVTWAIYSSLLVRWREWAKEYATSPMGFIVIGLIAGGVMALTKSYPVRLSSVGMMMTVLYGVGPLAVGYLLWEAALPRAKVSTLSLLGAATPILSVSLLCLFLKTIPGVELAVAAVLVSLGVVLSMRT